MQTYYISITPARIIAFFSVFAHGPPTSRMYVYICNVHRHSSFFSQPLTPVSHMYVEYMLHSFLAPRSLLGMLWYWLPSKVSISMNLHLKTAIGKPNPPMRTHNKQSITHYHHSPLLNTHTLLTLFSRRKIANETHFFLHIGVTHAHVAKFAITHHYHTTAKKHKTRSLICLPCHATPRDELEKKNELRRILCAMKPVKKVGMVVTNGNIFAYRERISRVYIHS